MNIWRAEALASAGAQWWTRPLFMRHRRRKTAAERAIRRCSRRAKASSGVCHEHERKLVVLYRRWEEVSRSRLTGAGFKPSSTAAFKRRGGERLGKRHHKMSGTHSEDERKRAVDDASLLPQGTAKTGVDHWLWDQPGRNLF